MKRWDLFFLVIRVPLDFLALFGAAVAAYFLRFETVIAAWHPGTQLISPAAYGQLAAWLSLLTVLLFALAGLYREQKQGVFDELTRVFFTVSGAMMFVVAAIFFRQEFYASRFIVLAVWGLGVVFVVLVRLFLRAARRLLRRSGIGVRAVAVIGEGKTAELVISELARGGEVMIAARLPRWDATALPAHTLDEIIVAEPSLPEAELRSILDFCDAYHTTIRFAARHPLLERGVARVAVVAGVPVIELRKTPLEGWGRVYKRVFDICVGLLVLFFAVPICIAIALAVFLRDRGPILFSQTRIGRLGRPFLLYKFRSMRPGAHEEWKELRERSEREGPVPKIKNDPRVTRVGQFIRRWSIDELPQLLNVLRGEMSLVGPRPHLPEEVAEYQNRHRRVLLLPPGITGLAQISGRADLSFEEEVRLDTFYIEHWSPKLDLAILAKTPLAVFSRKGAY